MAHEGQFEELTPTVATLLERHLGMAKQWYPHEMAPWSKGRDFEEGWTWSAEGSPVAKGVRSAIYVNLLTEDNLPYYTLALSRSFGASEKDGPWGEWSRRWTAEEDRHSTVIRDWVVISRIIDPAHLERNRMAQVSKGWFPEFANSPWDGIVYVTLQELATRVAHRNTGEHLAVDPDGKAIMSRVAADENLHYLFYRDLATAALELNQDELVQAMGRMVTNFEMPGTGLPGFTMHAYAIALAEIFDFGIFYENVLVPVVTRHWKLETLEGLSPEAEKARELVFQHMESVREAGERFADLRASAAAKPAQAATA